MVSGALGTQPVGKKLHVLMDTRLEAGTATTQPQLMVVVTVLAIAIYLQIVTSVTTATGDVNIYASTTMAPTHVVATLATKFLQEIGKSAIVSRFSFIVQRKNVN